jgi:molybdopterin-guanine dinucleotide biosynthesis protein A
MSVPHPSLPTDPATVTLAILAGGAGSRMGRAKGELRVGDRPILAHLLERLEWPGPTLLVTAPGRERPPACERFDREVSDPVAGEGPLRGVMTALDAAATDAVVLATVDMPGVTRDVLIHLLAALRPGMLGAMCERTTGDGPQIEPFPSAFRRAAAEVVRGQLGRRRRSVWSLSSDARFAVVPAPPSWPAAVWTNLNRPEDVAAFARANAGA